MYVLAPRSLTSCSVAADAERTLHLDVSIFFCQKCGKKYKWKGNLTYHLRYECGKDPQHFCALCSYKTKHSSSLSRHMRNIHKTGGDYVFGRDCK